MTVMLLTAGIIHGMLFVAHGVQTSTATISSDGETQGRFMKATAVHRPSQYIRRQPAGSTSVARSHARARARARTRAKSRPGELAEVPFELQEVLSSLVRDAGKDLLPIQETCSKLNVDRMGCLRVEAYIGKTLLNLKDRLHLKHKVRQQAFGKQDGDGEVTTKYGLKNAIQDRGRNPGWKDLEKDFRSVTNSIFDMPFILDLYDEAFLTPFRYPTLVKPAPVPDPSGNHVIGLFNRHRNHDPVKQLASIDIPFEKKSDGLVWRGATTGSYACPGQWKNGSRMLLVQKHFSTQDARIDVAFSLDLSPANGQAPLPPGWLRDHIDMKSLLEHKFIVVVDGNDVATSSEWVMASNSVPFMVPPVVQTWALHSWLQPWKHYVPLEPDFSDVSEKLDWAMSHPARAAQIASEGSSFMKEFENQEREGRIYAAVLVTYFDRFKIEDAPEEKSLVGESIPIQCN